MGCARQRGQRSEEGPRREVPDLNGGGREDHRTDARAQGFDAQIFRSILDEKTFRANWVWSSMTYVLLRAWMEPPTWNRQLPVIRYSLRRANEARFRQRGRCEPELQSSLSLQGVFITYLSAATAP